MQQVSKLTPQQEALLPKYKKKWQLTALSTQVIDRQKAVQTIEAIYKQISKVEEFDIYFFDSPACIANLSFLNRIYPAENWCNPKKLNNLIRRIENQLLRKFVGEDMYRQLVLPLIEIVGKQIDIQLWHYLEKELMFWSPLNGLISSNLVDKEKSSPIWKSAKPNQQERLQGLWIRLASGLVTPDTKCSTCCILDYCISELNCVPDQHLWQLLTAFINDLGWTFFFQDFCFACDRPCTVALDEKNQSHAEDGAAIQFSDGFKIFAEHGISTMEF
jgi:7,8-dihydro-6-hydroxymethylpterin-pyrophosphokinase